jgi:hypothetical protein
MLGMKIELINKCKWVGAGEKCKNHTLPDKSYCDKHYERVYTVMLPEMANYIIEKELKND